MWSVAICLRGPLPYACQVRWYCREAGVRALGQKLERVARKLALDVVKLQEGGGGGQGMGAGAEEGGARMGCREGGWKRQ